MTDNVKHLEMIQVIIQRMAANSFTLKGWSVMLISAIFAIAAGKREPLVIGVAYVPAIMFWILDGFFLRQERLFRALYDATRTQCVEVEVTYSMDTRSFSGAVDSWPRVMVSRTLLVFHGATVVAITLTVVLLFCGTAG